MTVKLIDLDFIEPTPEHRTRPQRGTDFYQPPEAYTTKSDGPILYTGEKSDACAMGLVLRELLAVSSLELGHVVQLHRIKTWNKAHPGTDLCSRSSTADTLQLDGDNAVQSEATTTLRLSAAPEDCSLKDIADTLLKRHPDKRLSCVKALQMPFFRIDSNFLSEQEFAEHAARILRMATVTDYGVTERLVEDCATLQN